MANRQDSSDIDRFKTPKKRAVNNELLTNRGERIHSTIGERLIWMNSIKGLKNELEPRIERVEKKLERM